MEEIFNIPEFKDMDVLAERIFKPDLRGIAKIQKSFQQCSIQISNNGLPFHFSHVSIDNARQTLLQKQVMQIPKKIPDIIDFAVKLSK